MNDSFVQVSSLKSDYRISPVCHRWQVWKVSPSDNDQSVKSREAGFLGLFHETFVVFLLVWCFSFTPLRSSPYSSGVQISPISSKSQRNFISRDSFIHWWDVGHQGRGPDLAKLVPSHLMLRAGWISPTFLRKSTDIRPKCSFNICIEGFTEAEPFTF